MNTSRDGLSRVMSTAMLLAALGLPMTACAQPHAAADSTVKPAQTIESAPAETTDAAPAPEAPAEETQVEVEVEEVDPAQAQRDAQDQELADLQREARLRQARIAAALAPLQEEKTHLETEIALLRARQQAAQVQAQINNDQANFAQQMELAELTRQVARMQAQMQAAQTGQQLQALKRAEELTLIAAENQRLAAQAGALQAELSLLQTQRTHASVDQDPMQYPANPLQDGTLQISDRRIPLNGAIGSGTADYVTQRLHYFNNLDPEAPIFIVIDMSPGGSVLEGFRIVQAMKNTDAPVHVVVKSFAASMAAAICTLADESYAYPNALILHHQMSSSMRGNLTQQAEQLEDGQEWARRLANPIAEKMGVTPERFTEMMYENNSNGDWVEFGDEAVKLKWVNHIVREIRETAITQAPGSTGPGRSARIMQADGQAAGQSASQTEFQGFTQWDLFNAPVQFEERTDGNGRHFVELPPLQPFDFYFLYDNTGYYRIAE